MGYRKQSSKLGEVLWCFFHKIRKVGRTNSIGINVWYATSDKKSVIMEMRLQIGQCG